MTLKKRKTGEKDVFEAILTERKLKSFISGIDLRPYVGGMFHFNIFAHVIPKNGTIRLNFTSTSQKDKVLRLNKDNIVLLTPEEHNLLDFGSKESRKKYSYDKSKEGFIVNWDKLYDKKEKLIEMIQDEL